MRLLMNRTELFHTARTAFLTSYPKIFTDIHNASEFFSKAISLSVRYGFDFQPSLFETRMCVEIESRYKALNSLIVTHLTEKTLIIELASGLSPRKSEFAQVPFYEIDLPEIIEIKKEIYNDMNIICDDLISMDLCDTTILYDILNEIIEKNIGKDILIVSEGLFWYLNRKDIQGIVDVLKKVFCDTKWKWLTSDCFAQETYEPDYRKVIAKSSNRSTIEPFRDFDDEFKFFSDNGLTLQRYKITELIDVCDVTSGSFFHISENEVKTRMNNYTDIACLSETNLLASI